jgi:hypothetical protein
LFTQVPQGEEVVAFGERYVALHAEIARWRYAHGDVAGAAPAHDVSHRGVEDQLEIRVRCYGDLHVQLDPA